MPTPEDFTSENYRIYWPAILAVFAVQMIVLIVISIAVANHTSFATASSGNTKVSPSSVGNPPDGSNRIGKK